MDTKKVVLSTEEFSELQNECSKNIIHIIVQKNCGYRFMLPLQYNCNLSDIYRGVSLFYSHIVDRPLSLYLSQDKKGYIPNNNTPLSQFIHEKKLNACTLIHDPIGYLFYLNMCNHD